MSILRPDGIPAAAMVIALVYPSPEAGRLLWVPQHLSILMLDGIPAAVMLTAVNTQVLRLADCCGCPSTCQFLDGHHPKQQQCPQP